MTIDQMDPVVERKSLEKPIEQASPEETAIGDIDDVVLDPAKEKKLLMKLDMAFVPIIMLTYLSCFLDRSNIGEYPPMHVPHEGGCR